MQLRKQCKQGKTFQNLPDTVIYATCDIYYHKWWQVGSPMAQVVRNLPAMQETQVQFLGQKDPLEKGMTAHSSILTWRITWTEEPGVLQS